MFIQPIDPYGIPLVNTLVLLSSGVAATYAHRSVTYRFGRYDVM